MRPHLTPSGAITGIVPESTKVNRRYRSIATTAYPDKKASDINVWYRYISLYTKK